jgi:hypothetical protein
MLLRHDSMDSAEKGQRYARIFRKAGVFLGKGDIARAVETLKEGEALASQLGDRTMAKRFADEIANASRPSGQQN